MPNDKYIPIPKDLEAVVFMIEGMNSNLCKKLDEILLEIQQINEELREGR